MILIFRSGEFGGERVGRREARRVWRTLFGGLVLRIFRGFGLELAVRPEKWKSSPGFWVGIVLKSEKRRLWR